MWRMKRLVLVATVFLAAMTRADDLREQAQSQMVAGQEAMSVGNFGKAIAHFKAAVALQPDATGPHAMLGLAFAAANRCEEAIPELETYIKLKKKDPQPTPMQALEDCRARLKPPPAAEPPPPPPPKAEPAKPRAATPKPPLRVALTVEVHTRYKSRPYPLDCTLLPNGATNGGDGCGYWLADRATALARNARARMHQAGFFVVNNASEPHDVDLEIRATFEMLTSGGAAGPAWLGVRLVGWRQGSQVALYDSPDLQLEEKSTWYPPVTNHLIDPALKAAQ
jgi:hypothetical protein